jgi:hypothetical protein
MICEMIVHLLVIVGLQNKKKNCSVVVHFCFENILRKCPVGQRNLPCISPVSCQVMAATEKQMKGVATWGRSGTFINILRHSVSARGGKSVCILLRIRGKVTYRLATCGS